MNGVKELWIGVKKINDFISHGALMNIPVLLDNYKMNITKIVKGQLILSYYHINNSSTCQSATFEIYHFYLERL